MAFFSVSVLKGATVIAICVLVLPLVSKLAEGSSCPIQSCISKCPSKCKEKTANSCQGAGGVDVGKCQINCERGCSANCPNGAACDCSSQCNRNCKGAWNPTRDACLSAVFNECKNSCEEDCKAPKVNS
jgi:hypothetical protein